MAFIIHTMSRTLDIFSFWQFLLCIRWRRCYVVYLWGAIIFFFCNKALEVALFLNWKINCLLPQHAWCGVWRQTIESLQMSRIKNLCPFSDPCNLLPLLDTYSCRLPIVIRNKFPQERIWRPTYVIESQTTCGFNNSWCKRVRYPVVYIRSGEAVQADDWIKSIFTTQSSIVFSNSCFLYLRDSFFLAFFNEKAFVLLVGRLNLAPKCW